MTETAQHPYLRTANEVRNDETGELLAYLYDADQRSVEYVLAAPVGEDPGRSPFTWIRLANGDLFLGVAPRGDVYVECVERLDGALPSPSVWHDNEGVWAQRGPQTLGPFKTEDEAVLARDGKLAETEPPPNRYLLRCIFRPQAWQRDNAIDVDPEGETVWEAEYATRPEYHSYESDELRNHPDAPEWVREWQGPFEVEYQVRYTVVGYYTDAVEADGTPQRYTSWFWADDPLHAEEQARQEVGETLTVTAVLFGEVRVAA